MGRNSPFLFGIAILFITIATYLFISAPNEDIEVTNEIHLNEESTSVPPSFTPPTRRVSHPCPYADVLGLDENTPNPHLKGGKVRPTAGATTTKPSSASSSSEPSPSTTTITDGETHETTPPETLHAPPSSTKTEL